MSSPTKPTTSIDDLPPEMICELFKYLHSKDLATCSMVNRRWHSISKVHSLVVTDHYPDWDLKWSGSNPKIPEEEVPPTVFDRLAEKPLLSNLKHLVLCIYESEFDLNELNRFQQLVHLEINIGRLNRKANLYLPKLKVLAFHRFSCSLSFDCPVLSTLLYRGENANLIKHPQTIRNLETDMVATKWLARFKNVECLVTKEFGAISKDTLLSLPRLRELRFKMDIEWLFEVKFRGVGSVDRVKRTLTEFLDEAKKLRGSDFRFTFSGLQLANVKLNQIDFGVQVDETSGRDRVCKESVYMKNYQLIEPGALHFIRHVDYTLLLSHVPGVFPCCFSQKFTGIQSVQATAEVPDADHLLWFLKSLSSLRRLELRTAFSQEFYDQLPASAHSLTDLQFGDQIGDRQYEDELQLNFDFIGKLSRLSELAIYPALSLGSLTSLIGSLGKSVMCSFKVRSEGELLLFRKERMRREWWVFKAGEVLIWSENPGEIVNFVKGLQVKGLKKGKASD